MSARTRSTIHPNRDRLRKAAEFSANGWPVVAEYEYFDLDGALLLIVFRLERDGEKTFRQGRPEGSGFVLKSKGAKLVPFHLKELRAAIDAGDTVYICEGEKDVLTVEAAGFPATCNPMGQGNPVAQYAKYFKGGKLVRIVADRDESGVGLEHAKAWAKSLEPIVETLEVVEAAEGKDAHDAIVVHKLPMVEAFVLADLTETAESEVSNEPPHQGSVRPKIFLNGRQARDIVNEMVDAIVATNAPPTLFRRTGKVVRVLRNDFGVGFAREVSPADYLNVVSGAADFVKFDVRSKSELQARPQKELSTAAFARLEMSAEIPVLHAVSPTPLIHDDGMIVAKEGFDPGTGVYYAPAADLKLAHVPEHPTHDEAQAAVAAILAPLNQMPFATDSDSANYLAVMLTAVLRTWFRTVPFIVIEAPIQGSGKTLAATLIRKIVEGTAGIGAAPEAGKQSEAEWRKRITSVLLSAPSVVIFDNVTGTLGGPSLAALATSPTWSDRLLSTNEAPELPNTPTWIFTSNNAQVDADLLRRCIFVRLDPHDPEPHLKSGFEIPDLVEHVGARRGEFLARLYTIVRFWISKGKPDPVAGTPTLGSFEKWSRVVPGILNSVGVDGALGDLEERRSMMRDPEQEEAAAFLESWWEIPHLREKVKARDLVDLAFTPDSPGRPEIAIPSSINLDKRANASRGLSAWLKFRRDRMVIAETGLVYTVRSAGGSTKRGLLWRVEREIVGESQ